MLPVCPILMTKWIGKPSWNTTRNSPKIPMVMALSTSLVPHGLWWPYYMLLTGATPFNADATACTLTDQAALDGFQAMVDLTLTDKVAPSANDLAAQDDWHMFEAGRIAMYPIGPWSITEFNDVIKDFDWDATTLPTGPNGKKVTFLFGNAYSVLAGSKQQEAAFEFMKFATGPEARSNSPGRWF